MDDVGLVKAPRICKMVREDSGYGFNLHGEKGVVGQYISAVDAGGSAERAGLNIGDRVVEVNGINVEAMSHAEVVSQIRSDPTQSTLLVVDKITDNYLKKINRPVTSSLSGYSSVHEIKISNTDKLAAMRISESDTPDANSVDTNGLPQEIGKSVEVRSADIPNKQLYVQMSRSLQENKESGDIPNEESGDIPNEQPSVVISKSPHEKREFIDEGSSDTPNEEPLPRQTPSVSEETPASPTSLEKISPPESPIAKESLSEKEKPADDTPDGVDEIKHGKKIADNMKSEELQDSGKKPKFSFITKPKRKVVKDSNTDWKSKKNMFDNL